MIDRSKLSQALARLDPRDREVLDYSLRRHVPDDDLAAVFGCGASDVARMRAAAVERLADDLAVQRGADLGQVLTALLDERTWADVPGAQAAVPEPASPPPDAPARPEEAGPRPELSAGPEDAAVRAETPSAHAEAPAPAESESGPARPVLGMLAGGRRGGEPADAQRAPSPPSTPGRRWTLVAAALIGALITIGIGAVILLGTEDGASGASQAEGGPRPFAPHGDALGEPFAAEPPAEDAPRYPVATIDRRTPLYDEPGGRRRLTVEPRTEWGSERVMSVVESRAGWLAVLVPELPNGEVAWLREADSARLDTVGWAIRADLAAREVVVERDGEEVRRFTVGVGRDDHPTPPGRYAVTDKLRVNDPGSPYGCCVVALTGHQTRLPPGWPGGDRLAIHATNDVSGIGQAVSLGCLRAHARDARWLMNRVPLGTPVFIEAGAAPDKTPRKPTSRKSRPAR